jgi:hypothetical protein
MSVDAYVVCDESKTYAYLGKLGAGGFFYGSLNRDPKGKKVGSFIGQHLGAPLRIIRCEGIPPDYEEWKEDCEEDKTVTHSDLREFFKESDKFYKVLGELHENIVDFTVYEEGELEPLLKGTVKWDGCSDWHFGRFYYPLYFYNKNQAKEFGLLLAGLYDWAAELMPQNKENLE